MNPGYFIDVDVSVEDYIAASSLDISSQNYGGYYSAPGVVYDAVSFPGGYSPRYAAPASYSASGKKIRTGLERLRSWKKVKVFASLVFTVDCLPFK